MLSVFACLPVSFSVSNRMRAGMCLCLGRGASETVALGGMSSQDGGLSVFWNEMAADDSLVIVSKAELLSDQSLSQLRSRY